MLPGFYSGRSVMTTLTLHYPQSRVTHRLLFGYVDIAWCTDWCPTKILNTQRTFSTFYLITVADRPLYAAVNRRRVRFSCRCTAGRVNMVSLTVYHITPVFYSCLKPHLFRRYFQRPSFFVVSEKQSCANQAFLLLELLTEYPSTRVILIFLRRR